MSPTGYTEDALVEQPAIALLAELGWETVNAYGEFDQGASTLGRETRAEVILTARLRPALRRLNPGAPPEAIDQAIEELTRDRSRMSMAAANREVYQLLKKGARVPLPDPEGDGETVEVVRVVDWDVPANNDFLLCSQLWVTGEMHTRRADLVGFVNGLPLLFIELKAAHRRLETAFTGNLRDYKDTIPQVFWPNGLIILSNGSQSRAGSVTAGWEHFAEWKRVGSESEAGRVSLETIKKVPFTFLYQAVTTDDFVLYLANHAKGAAYPAVNAEDFENADVLVASNQLLSSFDDKALPMAFLTHRLKAANTTLRRTRDLLLPRLISGEADVSELDIAVPEEALK